MSRRQTASRILLLGGLSAFGPLSMDMYLPGLPALARDFGTRESVIQLTLTSCLVGLAVGQLLAGPLSDALGRRRPLLAGLAGYVLVSAGCALAPTAGVLIGLRLLQGLGGGASIVIARAVVRDLYAGAAAARFFALLILVTGAAPMIAPLLGGQVLRFTAWRGIFVILAAIVAALAAGTFLKLRETLPAERRRAGGLKATLRSFRALLEDRPFIGHAFALSLAFAAMFTYVASSPFVLQGRYGLSAQAFSLVFAVNALGLMAAGQLSARVVGRVGPRRLLKAGLAANAAGGLALLAAVTVLDLGLAGVLPALFVVVASIGLVMPNATALALADQGEIAGAASAVVGLLQFAVAGVVAPLVGLGGASSAVPMAATMAALGLAAVAVRPRR
ncbi:MAG TPA: multidrug effflux MFS transporter [Solirubrobacteraceae bacterium]